MLVLGVSPWSSSCMTSPNMVKCIFVIPHESLFVKSRNMLEEHIKKSRKSFFKTLGNFSQSHFSKQETFKFSKCNQAWSKLFAWFKSLHLEDKRVLDMKVYLNIFTSLLISKGFIFFEFEKGLRTNFLLENFSSELSKKISSSLNFFNKRINYLDINESKYSRMDQAKFVEDSL